MAVDPTVLVNDLSLNSEDFRAMLRAAWFGTPGAFAGGVGARNGLAHGVASLGDMAVVQNGTPNMSVNVAAGMGLITGTVSADQGPYAVRNASTTNVTIAAADAVNPRDDLIIAQVRDAQFSGTEKDFRIVAVTGTPAATPSDPSLASFPNALVLARVRVGAGATSITNANITDLRTYAGAWALPFGRVASVSFGTNQPGISAVTDLIGMSLDAPMIEGRRYKVTAEATFQQLSVVGTVDFQLTTPGNSIYRQRRISLAASEQAPVTLTYEHVATATGSVGFKLRVGTTGGTVTARPTGVTEMNHVLMVEDIGPA